MTQYQPVLLHGISEAIRVSTATPDRTTADVALACPHCKKQFRPTVDATQPPRLQGAKCPNCKLFVPARIVSAAMAAARA